VFIFDLPLVAEDYVHRIGGTGRGGASGEAISLVSPDEGTLLRAIHRVLKADIEMREIEAYKPERGIRMGNDAPGRGRPTGQKPPRRGQAHAHAQPRQAHAHAGQRKPAANTQQRDRRSVNAPRMPRG
jgi:ATP-dependent RNA helicase RhlE